ncbi:hypothetical protein JY651_16615 [Pyxidicoccus parkwayensis]|uniref:Uncharacterized protein n=1 Tax=Pyxidicoccus parkwayensis TaxID=2813578 RepID=A0ABX7P7I6_9BACT|nr:hypothetical protein [Pyxidicoccus parkwaysis]QSQ26449.1 hypothetical protein JY651_16615 [Pyxidicoccus parkwaysis]
MNTGAVPTSNSLVEAEAGPGVQAYVGKNPSVAAGDDFLVAVWAEHEGVYAAGLTSDGAELWGGTRRVVDPSELAGTNTAVACTLGRACLVTWYAIDQYDATLCATLLQPGGGTRQVQLSELEGKDARVVANRDQFLVVWSSGSSPRTLQGLRFDNTGTRLDPAPFTLSTSNPPSRARVAALDDRYLVVWSSGGRIWGREVLTQVPGSLSAQVELGRASKGSPVPDVARQGDHWLVVWNEDLPRPTIRGVRVAPGGTVLDAPAARLLEVPEGGATVTNPTLASLGNEALLGYAEQGTQDGWTGWYIRGSRVRDTVLVDSPAVHLWQEPIAQGSQAVASGASGYLVAWRDERDKLTPAIYVMRVGVDGTLLDPGGIRLSRGPGADEPTVASDGQGFFVAWKESSPQGSIIRGARVSAAGEVLDKSGRLLTPSPAVRSMPSVAFNQGIYLVTWSETVDGATFVTRGLRVRVDGTVVDAEGLPLTEPGPEEGFPAVAPLGEGFLVTWWGQALSSCGEGIHAARVTVDGARLDASPIFVATARLSARPTLASEGGRVFVVWTDARLDAVLQGAWVSTDGTVTSPVLIEPQLTHKRSPTAIFDGAHHWVAWEQADGSNKQLWGVRVTPGGAVVDVNPVRLTTFNRTQNEAPVLAASGTGKLLLLYARPRPERGLPLPRIVGRRITTEGSPAP